ncbi:olfactory receptor 2D2-like [Pelobates fuscus]|uniref:olfactory receptor 2D2-like n=1 Tax=Pelobates fuscus TaxID=191477 RepID=UPI002FE43062
MTTSELEKNSIKHPRTSNLTFNERKALNELKMLDDVIIKPADKGGNIVLLNCDMYIEMCMAHLNDKNNYSILPSDPTEAYIKELENLLMKAMEQKIYVLMGLNKNVFPMLPIIYYEKSKMASHKLFKESGNASIVTEFILLGLSTDLNVQVLLFIVFLIIYMATLAGNILLITAVKTDIHLHSSMYLFLANLSFMDICYTSIIVPRMLRDFLTMNKLISLKVCTVQIFFYLFLGESECILLAFMAYDRYVAICNPLRYNIVMNIPFCTRMIAAAWMTGCVISFVDALFFYWLKFCGPNIIDHFFCESTSLIHLVCSDTPVFTVVIYVGDAILLPIPVFLVLFSYIRIIACIVRTRSGGSKSFSTCFSHLIVVVLFYGTAMFTYMRPRHAVTNATDKLVSVFYTIVTPMLNPLIYSLRNKDVQRAVKKIGNCISCI